MRLRTLVASGLVTAACAASPGPAKAPPEAAGTAPAPLVVAPAPAPAPAPGVDVTTEPQAVCDLVCERARIVPQPPDGSADQAQATENANRVLEAMQGDLLACYKKRIAANPKAHGFITVDIVIGPDGHVRTIETAGGAILGEQTMGCIVGRLQSAVFAPPKRGGTLRIQVPFSLRRVSPDEGV